MPVIIMSLFALPMKDVCHDHGVVCTADERRECCHHMRCRIKSYQWKIKFLIVPVGIMDVIIIRVGLAQIKLVLIGFIS
jgi:hypothetical protein